MQTVSSDVTYTAQWEKNATGNNFWLTNKNTKTSNAKKTPKTGDKSHMMLWIVLMLVAVAMSGVVVYRRKRS